MEVAICFSTPKVKVPDAPPVPNANAEAAKARRQQEMQAAKQLQGRAATILNTPLGDPNYGEDIRRTRLGGI